MSFLKDKFKYIVMCFLLSFIKAINVFLKDELKNEVGCADNNFSFGEGKLHLILVFKRNLNIRLFIF